MKISKGKIVLYNGINRSLFSGMDPVNLGLLAISAVLKQHGYQTVLIPNIDDPKSLQILKKEIKSALMVGVSCMTGDPLLNAIKFSQIAKRLKPNIPICWGGYHVTFDYHNSMKEDFIDYIIRGQGEKSVIELLTSIQKNINFNL